MHSTSIPQQRKAACIQRTSASPAAKIIVALRWYSRAKLSGTHGIEDMAVTLALVFSMAFTGTVGGEFGIDLQSKSDEVRASLLSTIMKIMFAGSIFYHTAVNLVRFSILFQYHRLFQHLLTFRLCIYVIGVATLGAMAWGILGIVFLCNPVRKYWHSGMPGKYMDAGDHFWSCSLVGVVLDCIIWVMPMPVLGRLKLRGRQKVGLLVPFGLGLFVCIVSVLRIVHVHGAAETGNVSKSGSYAAIWSTAETNVAIICSSLIVMKPLLARAVPGMGTETRVLSQQYDSAIRRVMSIATLEESFASTEDAGEARYEAYVWTNSGDNAIEGRTIPMKGSA
ncbi:hypothetical protein PMIN06_001580 [Paraphaeosphaeria minitans]